MNPTEDLHLGLVPPPSASGGESLPKVEDPRVLQAVEEYLAARQAGGGPERQAFLDRHADIAAALAECLDGLDFIQAVAPRLQDSAVEVAAEAAGAAVRPGDLLGDYRIVREVGRGGMGVVYKALHLALKRTVALKMVLAGRHAGAHELARFRVEAEAVARLQHPNIVQVHEVGEHDGLPFLSLEFVEGGRLDRKLAGTPQPARPAAELVETLARAMHVAHQHGIVHRDLKPANVLLTEGPDTPLGQCIPKITDFGLAKRLEEAGQTQSGAILGTPSYMAPEQAAGDSKQIGPATDVYALGAILYELLSGRPPFKAASVHETLEQVRHQEPVAPRHLQPTVPRDLQTICLKCLHKEPHRRYASALALAEDLRRFLRGEPIKARPVGLGERAVKWARRRPAHAALAGALLLTALFGLASAVSYGLYQGQKAADLARQLQRQQARQRSLDRYWTQGLEAETARKYDDARGHFDNALGILNTEPEPGDEDFRSRIEDHRRQVAARLEEKARREEALKEWKAARHDGEEAQFLFYRDVMTGLEAPESVQAARALAWKALGRFQVNPQTAAVPALEYYDEVEKPQILADCYQLLFLLAEAETRSAPAPGPDSRERQARAALQLLDRAAELGLRTRSYHLHRAQCLDWLGDQAGARAARAEADAHQPDNALDFFLLGRDELFAHPGDLHRALALLESSTRLQGDHFWAHYFQAVAYQRLQQPAEARARLTICIEKRPDFPWSYVLRGFLSGELASAARDAQLVQTEFRSADADFDQAARLLRATPDEFVEYILHVNRGVVRLRQAEALRPAENLLAHPGLSSLGVPPLCAGLAQVSYEQHLGQAVDDFRTAIRLQPGQFHAYVNLATAYEQRRQLKEAVEQMDRAIETYRAQRKQAGVQGPGGDFLFKQYLSSLFRTRARLQMKREQWQPALGDLAEAMKADPAGVESPYQGRDRLECAYALYCLQRYDEALRECAAALRAAPDHPGALRLRAEVLLQLGSYPEARAALDRYLERGRAGADVLRKHALVSAELGDFPTALEDYARALALEPGDVRLRSARGWTYLVMDAPRLALDDFEQVLRLDPESGEAYAGCGYARAKLGQYRGATADAEEALRRGPRDRRLLAIVARIYAQAVGRLDAEAGPSGRPTLERRPPYQDYQDRAVEALRAVVESLPPRERPAYWKKHVQDDPDLAPIRHSRGFAQLARECLGPAR